MSAPLRFLSVAVLAWAAIRATTLGALPGFTVSHAAAAPPPPIVATELSRPLPANAAEALGPWAMPPVAGGFAPPQVRLAAAP